MNPEFEALVNELSLAATDRYLTAVYQENMTPGEAMREIVRTILEKYRARLAA